MCVLVTSTLHWDIPSPQPFLCLFSEWSTRQQAASIAAFDHPCTPLFSQYVVTSYSTNCPPFLPGSLYCFPQGDRTANSEEHYWKAGSWKPLWAGPGGNLKVDSGVFQTPTVQDKGLTSLETTASIFQLSQAQALQEECANVIVAVLRC